MNAPTPGIILPPPPPQLVVPNVGTDIAAYVTRYLTIRDKKKQMQDRHKQELAPINQALDVIEQGFLNHLNATNSDNTVANGVGTAYRATRSSATIENGDEFRRHVIGSEAWHLVDWRANANSILEDMEANGQPVPGIKFSTDTYVNIRRA